MKGKTNAYIILPNIRNDLNDGLAIISRRIALGVVDVRVPASYVSHVSVRTTKNTIAFCEQASAFVPEEHVHRQIDVKYERKV